MGACEAAASEVRAALLRPSLEGWVKVLVVSAYRAALLVREELFAQTALPTHLLPLPLTVRSVEESLALAALTLLPPHPGGEGETEEVRLGLESFGNPVR